MTAVQEAPAASPEIGRDRRRKEDQRLITGRTRWTDNLNLPGMVHMAILRSPYAHARLTNVDVSGALAQPNVIAAFSGADLDNQGVLACAWPVTEDMVAPTYLPLAIDEVRHVGEPVAVVVARDKASAVDALEAITVDYETRSGRPAWRRARSGRLPGMQPGWCCTAWRIRWAASCSGRHIHSVLSLIQCSL